jgi:TonB family protein
MTLTTYLIHSAYLLAFVWLVYVALLRNLRYFLLNRAFLIVGLLLAILAPLLPSVAPKVIGEIPILTLPEFVVSPEADEAQGFSLKHFIPHIYLAGILYFLLRYYFRLKGIFHLLRKARSDNHGMSQVRTLNGMGGAFTFFNRILMDDNHIAPEAQRAVLRHEMVHLRQWHSLDILLIDLIRILQWFNPFVYAMKRELQQVHEFLADREGLQREDRPGEYLQALQTYVLTNQNSMKITAAFGNVSLKRRLKMMTRTKQKGMMLRYGAASVMMVCCFLILPAGSLSENKATPEWLTSQPATATDLQEKEVPPYKMAPQYPGGESALVAYLASAVKYPEDARKKGTKGTVYVSFIVSKDGDVKNAKVIRGIGDGCDEVALKAIQEMPRWSSGLNHQDQPIDVELTIPVKFELSGKEGSDQ